MLFTVERAVNVTRHLLTFLFLRLRSRQSCELMTSGRFTFFRDLEQYQLIRTSDFVLG